MLLDRHFEREELDRALATAREGSSAVLVLRGEPGVGKTALLDYAVDAAGGLAVVRLVGIESERELGFASLHQLLRPFLERLDALPGPQYRALATAFGLREGSPPDRFLVGLAALTLLSDAATRRPVLCVVDDAQWLDKESARAIAFVARRLNTDAVAVLFAVRDLREGPTALEALPQLHVCGLPPTEAQQLLASTGSSHLADHVSQRIVSETSGNPLALIELGRELTPEQLAGETSLPEPLPLPRALEAKFVRQVRSLPAATQMLLLTAAADPTGDPALLWRAGERLGFGITAAAAAEAGDLVTFGPPVRFRHPLVRSAVYHSATLIERKRAHEALAEATDPSLDADRRAWHRAEASALPDEAVAAELERAADRAKSRGGWAASGAFLTRAVALTPDPAVRRRRLLAAAEAETTAGAPLRAQSLLDSLVGQLDDPFERGLARRAQGAIRYALDETGETVSVLLGAAQELAPLDVHQARKALLDALTAARVSARFAVEGASDVDIAPVAHSMPLPPGSTVTIGDLLLDATTALLLGGYEAAAALLHRAVAVLKGASLDSADMLAWTGTACWAAGALGDDEVLHALASRLEQGARDQGALLHLSNALIFTGVSELFAGRLNEARAHFTERGAIEAARGDSCNLGQVLVLAWRGRANETRARAATVIRAATERAQGWKLVWIEYAFALLELGLGHYQEALAAAPRGYDEDRLLSAFALPDLVEAAARCGQLAFAEQALERVALRAAANPTPLSLGLLARSRALLTDGPDAEGLYQVAIAQLRQARGASHLARAHLLYGEWLRRVKRRRDAREQLRTAHGIFETIGADAFAQRARLELTATGETARKRTLEQRSELTSQELQVAALASTGATNPEIAAQLFISPKTVDYHLAKVFRKLGVASRRQLARSL